MKKYTFILEYKGGTYISQVKEKNVKRALSSWAKNIDTEVIKHFGQESKKELVALMNTEEPLLINDMDNVWCISGTLKRGYFIANIVES